jgi:hypothetical protein
MKTPSVSCHLRYVAGKTLVALVLLVPASPLPAADIIDAIIGRDPGTPVWSEGPHQYVRTVKQDRFEEYARPPKNEHPASLDPDDIARALASLSLDGGGGALFESGSILLVAPHISDGLSRCNERQDVIFSIVHSDGERPQSVTTARTFVTGSKLNLILGQVRTPLPIKHERPGRRKEPVDENIQITAGPGISFERQGRELRSDWIRIDVPATVAAYRGPALNTQRPPPRTVSPDVLAPDPAPVLDDTPSVSSAAALSEENRRLREELARLRRENSANSPAARPSAAELDPRSMENRLARLKALHEKALITDEDYETKRRQILEEL